MIIALLLILSSSVFAADQWDKTAPLSSANPGTISTLLQTNNEALDRFLAYGVFGCKVSYSTAAQITVGTGSVVCSNNTGAVRRLRANTSSTSVTFTDLDVGSESSSTTYYVWALADTDATTFTCKISTSSSAPTGATYYRRLGSFYNDASGNITQLDITNDNDSSAALTSYDSGWFAVSADTTYTKTHSLGTTKVITMLYGSNTSDGSGTVGIHGMYMHYDASNGHRGENIVSLSTTTIAVRAKSSVFRMIDSSGNDVDASSGYYRIIMLALK